MMKLIQERVLRTIDTPENEHLKGEMLDEIVAAYYPLSMFQNKRQQQEAQYSFAETLALTCKLSVVKRAYDQFKKSPMTQADAEDVIEWLEPRRERKTPV